MDQQKNPSRPQFLYLGRWVNQDNFRAFVYNETGKKLANSYKEYMDLTNSGLWFPSVDEIKPKETINAKVGRKTRNGSDS